MTDTTQVKMTDTTQVTNTLFKSKKISFETKNDDYRFVTSTQNIKKGELLLIEHVYCTEDSNIIQNVILHSPELFNNLYPRKIPWTEKIIQEQEQTDEIIELIEEKMNKNSFNTFNILGVTWTIGLDISKFNHSNVPNAYVGFYRNFIIHDTDVKCALGYVYSTCDITTGEEITISYGSGYVLKQFGEIIEEYNPPFKLQHDYIENIVIQYTRKDICRTIMFNHICIYYGVYLIDDMICSTKRFIEYFTKTIKKKCNNENMIEWLIEKKEMCYSGSISV